MRNQSKLKKVTETESERGGELLSTSISEEKTDKVDYSKLVEQEPMKNVPVLMTRIRQSQDDEWGGWYGVIGRSKVTPEFDTQEELVDHFYESGINPEFFSTLINLVAGHMDAIKAFTEQELGGNK